MRAWLGIGLLGAALLAAVEPPITVAALIGQLRAAVAGGEKDDRTAKSISKLKLSERLDNRVIEELESEGAGPKTVAQLSELREASEKLPPAVGPLPFADEPAPPPAERSRTISYARANALAYNKSLPDFICRQVVRRFENFRGGWMPKDTLEVRLSFFEQREEYLLETVNGRRTLRTYRQAGGAVSEGEFGTLLRNTFAPASHADFRWDHWTTLRKRRAHVFEYRVLPANSVARLLAYVPSGANYETVVGQHGYVYIDRETNMVMRIVAESVGMPPRFPVKEAVTVMDYDFADVGGRQYLLPLRAEVRMTTADFSTRNEVEFREYRKYGADSSITFGEIR